MRSSSWFILRRLPSVSITLFWSRSRLSHIKMHRFLFAFLAVLLGAHLAAADCEAGTTVGPCLCIEDANSELALQCSGVTDGADITAALVEIDVAQISSIDIRDSPDLTTLPDDAFGTTTVLALRLYNTGLTSLASTVFGTSSETLQSLNIKYSSAFTEFDPAIVSSLTALEQLIVSSCGITELIGALESETLEYADFTRNQITTISEDYFLGTSVTVVLLSFNEMVSEDFIGASIGFTAPEQDLYLDLGYNRFSMGLRNVSYSDAAPRELILSGNGISQLSEASFSSIMDVMAAQYAGLEPYILIDNNPLECGCDAAWVASHASRAVLRDGLCVNGQLLDNLGPSDFADC